METIIFCFSGTGNSLSVAREVAEKLGNTQVMMMTDVDIKGLDLVNKRVGLVFPAYYSSLPPVVERFIAKLSMETVSYTFAIITAGAMFGKSLEHLALLISNQGGRLDAGYQVRMPGNYIAMYSAWPQWLQKRMLKKAVIKTRNISDEIKVKTVKNYNVQSVNSKKSLDVKMHEYNSFAKDYLVNDKCTTCGQCAKLCPMENILMVNGKPQFGKQCERCMACIQWCPVKAIEYKDVTRNRIQYRNPNVKVNDLYHNHKNQY